jgi:hypothetical protein
LCNTLKKQYWYIHKKTYIKTRPDHGGDLMAQYRSDGLEKKQPAPQFWPKSPKSAKNVLFFRRRRKDLRRSLARKNEAASGPWDPWTYNSVIDREAK